MNVHDGQFVTRGLAFIDDSQAEKLNGVTVLKGDVLLNITGASVARVCVVPPSTLPARVNQHVCIIRPSSAINSIYLQQLLQNSSVKSNLLGIAGSGATREAITKSQLENFRIPVPPTGVQGDFSTRVEAIQHNKAVQRLGILDGEALFGSLQAEAFGDES